MGTKGEMGYFCRMRTLFYTSLANLCHIKDCLIPCQTKKHETHMHACRKLEEFRQETAEVCWISSLVGIHQDQPIMVFK